MKKKTEKAILKVAKKLNEAHVALSDLWNILEDDDVRLDYADGSSRKLLDYVKDDTKVISNYEQSWHIVLRKLGI